MEGIQSHSMSHYPILKTMCTGHNNHGGVVVPSLSGALQKKFIWVQNGVEAKNRYEGAVGHDLEQQHPQRDRVTCQTRDPTERVGLRAVHWSSHRIASTNQHATSMRTHPQHTVCGGAAPDSIGACSGWQAPISTQHAPDSMGTYCQYLGVVEHVTRRGSAAMRRTVAMIDYQAQASNMYHQEAEPGPGGPCAGLGHQGLRT